MPLYCQRALALRLETKHLVDGGMLHATEDDILNVEGTRAFSERCSIVNVRSSIGDRIKSTPKEIMAGSN